MIELNNIKIGFPFIKLTSVIIPLPPAPFLLQGGGEGEVKKKFIE